MQQGLKILDKLTIADPDTYLWVKGRMTLLPSVPDDEVLALMVEEIIWGLSQERGLASAFAEGLLTLIQHGYEQRIDTYAGLVRQAAKTGATLGRIVATFSTPVVMASAELLTDFTKTMAIMQAKGTYTISAPMEVLVQLLKERDIASTTAYLELLSATFQQHISYNLSLRMVYLLPKAVREFAPQRRLGQIQTMVRLVEIDLQLVDSFIEGLPKGLDLLDASALDRFVGQALQRHQLSEDAGKKYLSLMSKVSQDDCAAMQKAVVLASIRGQLNRYLQARIGQSVAIRPLSDIGAVSDAIPWVCSDGRAIYLIGETSYHQTSDQNRDLYKNLVRLEAGYFEYGSFDFDLDRALDQFPDMGRRTELRSSHLHRTADGDGETFIRSFPLPALADDLLTLFEQARVALRMQGDYPGLMRQVMPELQKEFKRNLAGNASMVLAESYANLVLGTQLNLPGTCLPFKVAKQLVALYEAHSQPHESVEKSAQLVCLAIDMLSRDFGASLVPYESLLPPYGRRLHWNLVGRAFSAAESTVQRLREIFKAHGLSVYRSDLRRRLAAGQGRLGTEDVVKLVLSGTDNHARGQSILLASNQELESLLKSAGIAVNPAPATNVPSFRYPEWDVHAHDYLHNHTFVQEIDVPSESDGQVYHQILSRHNALVTRMRRAFEQLKPEGLSLLRQWPEGDDFDYRALIDFAIDRRAGLIPSQRLFIKRLKQQRDVAVLLLVDLSRSTANPVSGRRSTVLGVAKEALVLFCEALQVVGDAYAIAGFSGTGRHSVDYFRIKDFEEQLSDQVQTRISALEPQRSTRMGAAMRHATAQLMRVTSRVRLMIVLSDGFPNDVGYKSDYAIADTCRAVQEARARNFHVKAITVNIGSDPRLDELYGRVHHHVIGDVTELPDKLLRLYSVLTRY